MNKPKILDNSAVSDFLGVYLNCTEACLEWSEIDDILTGSLGLGTEGDSSTRSLSRHNLFQVLQLSRQISVIETGAILHHKSYSKRSLELYTQLARVASKALANLLICIENSKT